MTIKERAQVLYDFSTCPNVEDSKNCAASGLSCALPILREARDVFLKETADVLMKLSENK